MMEKKMTQNEFIEKFKAAINTEKDITSNMSLAEIDEWDSLGMACTISLFSEEFGKNIDYAQMESFKTVADLINAAGIN